MFGNSDHFEENFATPMEAMREEARVRGAARPEVAWINTSFDVWLPNPYYVGAPVPHPEDDPYCRVCDAPASSECVYHDFIDGIEEPAAAPLVASDADPDDIPF
jgi:hypothetical protein